MLAKSYIDHDSSPKLKVLLSEDEVFAKRLMDRDKTAFKMLYRKYASLIYGRILSKVANQYQAEQLLEQTFIQAYHNIHDFDFVKIKLFTWLNQIAKKQLDKQLFNG
ncbi:RNA polymerase sigma factor [Pedobacter rhizosphaerae]|uniref:Sigma-70 region 2 n=1 Tax=Pedobacter rhizosphaerae TaxID=390241 RepID=A0A1H9VB91_9SPHI|nr:sigma factor [Pedobacter rhizosphaerae]SES18791.1 Sigma-70 region 2 [Pedobacter rhizosphaerae]